MQLRKPGRKGSGNRTIPLVALIILIAALTFAFRLHAFTGFDSGNGAALRPTETVSLAQQIRPQPTATPTPTATPLPAPIKKTNAPAPIVSAAGAVAIDERSGAILYEKNPHLRRAPASVTKIVTAIVAIERGNVNDIVAVNYDASELVDSTVMGVNPGDRISLEDLLYGLMLPSGNEAALAIANHIAGSEQAFVNLMNEKMRELGLNDSHFANPHGLDENGHYSSAYDMAMVSRYGMRDPFFRKLAAAKLHPVTLWRDGEKRSYDVFNLNRLLWIYAGADGIKVGFTETAMRTIVGSAVRDGHRVYVALMGSTDLWTDTPQVLDYVFDNFTWPAGR